MTHRLTIRIELDDLELVVAGTEFSSLDSLEQRIAEVSDKIITSIKVKRNGTLKLDSPVDGQPGVFVVDNDCIDSYEDEDR